MFHVVVAWISFAGIKSRSGIFISQMVSLNLLQPIFLKTKNKRKSPTFFLPWRCFLFVFSSKQNIQLDWIPSRICPTRGNARKRIIRGVSDETRISEPYLPRNARRENMGFQVLFSYATCNSRLNTGMHMRVHRHRRAAPHDAPHILPYNRTQLGQPTGAYYCFEFRVSNHHPNFLRAEYPTQLPK